MTERTRKGQQGRRLPTAKVAAAIAFAEQNGNEAAAKKFGVATRTVESYRSKDRHGKLPAASALAEQFRNEATRKHADLLGETLEKTLRRIQKLLPDASITECTKVAETLGDLTIQRDFIGDGHAGTSAGRKDQAARATAERGSGAPSASTDGPVH